MKSFGAGRDPRDAREMKEDAERLLDEARARGRIDFAVTWFALLWDLIAGTGHDLARALRLLVRAPGFTVTVSLLLGLGVAATTTLFALVNAVILKPLPYANPEQLVMVWESNVSRERLREGPSPGNVEDWVSHSDAFEALTAWWTTSATLRGRDGSAPVAGVQVTKGFFEVFRRAPLLGRTFTDQTSAGLRSRPAELAARSRSSCSVIVCGIASAPIRRWSEERSSLKAATGVCSASCPPTLPCLMSMPLSGLHGICARPIVVRDFPTARLAIFDSCASSVG